MGDAFQFTAEQFQELLGAIRAGHGVKAPAAGLGAPGNPFGREGLGCGSGGLGPNMGSVEQMLAAGSPRLALAKALGVPFAPYLINVRATFPDTTTSVVPDVGSDVKIVQDTLIDAMVARVSNDNTPTNVFQTLSDFFFNFQSGIEATLEVQGAPRYSVAPRFTPISTLADMAVGSSHWPHGWVLTYQQQLFMSFRASIALPDFPITVCCTFRGWTPQGEKFVDMTNRQAIAGLAECGITVDEAYVNRVCR